jgi:YD repeat-containing protein
MGSYSIDFHVTQITDSLSGVIARQYDGMNRLTQEITPQGTVNYTYDAAGRRTTLQVAGQPVINYTWDDANRLVQMSQGTSSIAFAYDAAGKRTRTTLANGASMEYTYDNANQLTQIVYKQGASVTGNVTYTYDAAGRRTGQGGTASFASANLPAPTTATALYDANNRLASWNGATYTYDANGNLTGDGQKTYTWDTRNQLQGIAGAASFAYDAFGRRIYKAIGVQQTVILSTFD